MTTSRLDGVNQKFNDNTLCVISSTHSGDIYTIQGSTIEHKDSVEIILEPYPDKHGELSSSGKEGQLQKSGMVYERDHEEEIQEYVDTITQKVQDYIKKNDDKIQHIIVTLPAKIKGSFQAALEKTLHNVHLSSIHYVEGNYTKTNINDAFDIINKKLPSS